MAKKFTADELQQIDTDWRSLFESQEYAFILVDQSVAQRKTLVNALLGAGAEAVLEAKDGTEAIMALKNLKAKPVFITELNLPVMSGVKLIKQLRGKPETKDTPVILVSAESRKDKIIPAIQCGIQAYLKKPCPPQALIDKVKELGYL